VCVCVCYIIILDMFRAVPCSSSGGQIVLLQHLLLSLSVNGCIVRRLRADSKHVGDYNVTYIYIYTRILL